MKRLIHLILLTIAGLLTLSAAEVRYFSLSGRVLDAITKADLTQAYVLLYDSVGNVRDTVRADRGLRIVNGEEQQLARFYFKVDRTDSTYIFDVECPGYQPTTVTYRVEKVGKREDYRTIPTIYLNRAPHKLGEVTVTASKIKFYHKGDTIVYNADAFQLAEGSMLDGLVAMLPGAEINENGQIKINGEFVESLLLNGKQFFDGNNQLMLENIAAYTVKNIEVYEGQTEKEKWENNPNADKHLTMNVKLKKEYNMGWILNAQAGGGTESRYTGRLFASLFTPTTNITLLGNINNLNDNRKPGKSDTWTPEMMPSGTKEYKMGGLNYRYDTPENDRSASGHITFEQTTTNYNRSTARTNFLTGGNTYENSYSHTHDRNLKLETRHQAWKSTDRFWLGAMALGRYVEKKNAASSLSGVFSAEQPQMTSQLLDAIYSTGTPEEISSIINRSATRTDGSRHEWEVQAFPNIAWKIPQTHDRLSLEVGVKYNSNKEDRWKDYTINYGSDPTPAERRRQYFDNSPNHQLTLMSNLTYNTYLSPVNLTINYEYRFFDRERDSYMYALDRLEDLGVFGVLPAGYLDTFDPANSYTSRLIENTHTISPTIGYYGYIPKNKSRLFITAGAAVALRHSRLDYWRGMRDFRLSKDYLLTTVSRWNAHIEWCLHNQTPNERRSNFRHTIEYRYQLTPKTPDMVQMLDFVDDTDPLNITEGNPDLRTQYTHTQTLSYRYSPRLQAHPISNRLELTHTLESNTLTRGYTYDTSTGIRHTRTYNVDGNSSVSARNNLNLQFGDKDQFTITSSTNASLNRYADMIGVNLSAPVREKVDTRILSEKISLSWQIGKQNLQIVGNLANRHSTSTRADFNTIDANHFSYGFIGNFVLPAGFGISTDFNLYTRRGYGVKELDTTDAIWNARLTYTPPRSKRWVFMIDAFDMLHQLSNVNYAVTASGRSVSYSNTLPRYVLFSAQYRFTINPKKKK